MTRDQNRREIGLGWIRGGMSIDQREERDFGRLDGGMGREERGERDFREPRRRHD
jgi:hypothetical protein